MTILSNLIGRTAIAVRAGVHKSMVLETPDHFSFPAHKKKKEKGRRRQTSPWHKVELPTHIRHCIVYYINMDTSRDFYPRVKV